MSELNDSVSISENQLQNISMNKFHLYFKQNRQVQKNILLKLEISTALSEKLKFSPCFQKYSKSQQQKRI